MGPGPYPDHSCTIPARVVVPVQWTSGSTGAVPALSAFKFKTGVKSVTRNGAGDYTIVLNSPCKNATAFSGSVNQASFALSGACQVVLKADTSTNLTTPAIRFQVCTAPGVAVDPASGDVVRLELGLQWTNPL